MRGCGAVASSRLAIRRDLQVGICIAPQKRNPSEPIFGIDEPACPLKFIGLQDAGRSRVLRTDEPAAHRAWRDPYLRVIPDTFVLAQFAAGHYVQPLIIFGEPDRSGNGYAVLPKRCEVDVLLPMNLGWNCHTSILIHWRPCRGAHACR